jgi:hypothetical protein
MTTEAIAISLPVSIDAVRKDRAALVEWLRDELSQAGLRLTGPYEGRYHLKGLIALTLPSSILTPHTSCGWSSRKCMDSNREARPDTWALVNWRQKGPQF